MKALFISDVHLTDLTSPRCVEFLRFLDETVPQYERLYILGDLFDAWVGTRPVFLKQFAPVLERLRNWSGAGIRISYIEGNHDFCLGEDLADELGIQIFDEFIEENWDGRRVYLCHGDTLDRNDQGTLWLRTFLRSDVIQTASGLIPGKFLQFVASRTSHASRDYQAKGFRDENKIREKYRGFANGLFQQGYDVVICGHTHVPDTFRITHQGRPCEFHNIGDWVSTFTFLTYENGEFSRPRTPQS